MKYRTSIGSKIFDAFNYLLIFIIVLSCIYPFVYMFSISTSNYYEVGTNTVVFWPKGFHLNAYEQLFRTGPFIFQAYGNSIVYTLVHTFFVLFLCSAGGFALSLQELAFKKTWSLILFIMMFFSGGMIPTFLLIRSLGMLNTLWAIVLPGAVAPFYVFIFRIYIKVNIHPDLIDSVYCDGGSDLTVFIRIVLPLIKPMLATIGLFAAIGMWNSFIPAMIYLTDRKKYPLALFLREYVILGSHTTLRGEMEDLARMSIREREGMQSPERAMYSLGWTKAMKMTFTMITVVPILFVYPFAQRYFVKGIMVGSLKE